MKILFVLIMVTLLPCGEEAWSRMLNVPVTIRELGQIIDSDLGNDATEIVLDYKVYLVEPNTLSHERALRLVRVYSYINRRFLGPRNSNSHLNDLLKQALVNGKAFLRYDNVDGIMLAYIVYKEGGKYRNMEFDLEKRMELKSDTVAPILMLDLDDKSGG